MKFIVGSMFGFMIIMASSIFITSDALSSPLVFPDDDHKYVGAKKCRPCHKGPKKGNQFEIWSESKHSQAYAILGMPEAIAIAKEKGIENPQADVKCLKCHVTANDAADELKGKKYSIDDGVSCETCHGAGGDYWKAKTMKGIAAGTIDAASVGFTKPGKELCLGCHNDESPNYKGFDFDKYWAKIAHPIPE